MSFNSEWLYITKMYVQTNEVEDYDYWYNNLVLRYVEQWYDKHECAWS